MLLFNKYNVLQAVEAPPAGGGTLTRDGIMEALAADDEKPEIIDLDDKGEKEPKEEKTEEKAEEKEDELSQFEDDDEKQDDEDLELVTVPRRKEILKQYPDIFKKFPGMERALYRERQFTEIFDSVESARESSEKASALDGIEESLGKGNIGDLLENLKDTDKNGYFKVIDNFLPQLAEKDSVAYGIVIGNVLKHAVRTMIADSRKLQKTNPKDTDLEVAANILYKYSFGSSEWEDPRRLSGEEKPEDPNDPEKKAEEREQQITQREFNRSVDGLNSRVDNSIKSTIDANIDPKEQMTPYVKKQAARDAYEEVSRILGTDRRLQEVLDRLWQKAFDSDFSQKDLDTIRNAYTTRARAVLPAALKKARIEALKGMGKNVSSKDDDEDTDRGSSRRSETPKTHRRSEPVSKVKNAKDIPRGMSSLDFLNAED